MEIPEIKNHLTLSEVIKYYGLKADKQNRLKCPFHDDKTPSLQLYYKTQTAFCFSTNCTTHGKAIDVIDFILYYEKCSKHEAIQRAVALITNDELKITNTKAVSPNTARAMFLDAPDHIKVYQFQMSPPTWNGTTPYFKEYEKELPKK